MTIICLKKSINYTQAACVGYEDDQDEKAYTHIFFQMEKCFKVKQIYSQTRTMVNVLRF